MPTKVAVVDSGVLVAAAHRSDRHHRACAELLESLEFDFVVPAFCVAEACHFIAERAGPQVEAAFLSGLESLPVVAPESGDWERIAGLVRQYAGFGLGGTDAAIVVLAEQLSTDLIATLDHRHFRAIKPRHCEFFQLLPEL
ncbi:MAG: type II toxin-antitoxin system VapC family toxin [Tepidiformaceae bacterium]